MVMGLSASFDNDDTSEAAHLKISICIIDPIPKQESHSTTFEKPKNLRSVTVMETQLKSPTVPKIVATLTLPSIMSFSRHDILNIL